MSTNTVGIVGRLTRDMEERKAGSVYSFSLAFNQREKIDGEWKDVPGFIQCAIYGKRGAALMPHLMKGTKVAIFGHLEYHAWTSKDGSKKHDIALAVDDLEFMSSRRQSKPDTDEIPFS